MRTTYRSRRTRTEKGSPRLTRPFGAGAAASAASNFHSGRGPTLPQSVNFGPEPRLLPLKRPFQTSNYTGEVSFVFKLPRPTTNKAREKSHLILMKPLMRGGGGGGAVVPFTSKTTQTLNNARKGNFVPLKCPVKPQIKGRRSILYLTHPFNLNECGGKVPFASKTALLVKL